MKSDIIDKSSENVLLNENEELVLKSSNYLRIIFCKYGSCEIVTKNTVLTFGEGEAFIYPFYNEVIIKGISNNSKLFIFSVNIFSDLYIMADSPAVLISEKNSALSLSMKELADISPDTNNYVFLYINSLEHKITYNALLHVDKYLVDISPRLSAAIIYIENNISQSITTADLASECNLSESAIYKLFNSSIGKSPNKYIRERRMKTAAFLLINTDKYISDIAYETGYYDQYYFSKEFKKEYGVSPSEYKKMHK